MLHCTAAAAAAAPALRPNIIAINDNTKQTRRRRDGDERPADTELEK